MRFKTPGLILSLALITVFLVPIFSGAVDLDVSSDTVTIKDLTPGGDVLISWAGKAHGVIPTVYWDTQVLSDDDWDGKVVIENLEPVATRNSIWAVADIGSCAVIVAQLHGASKQPSDLTERAQATDTAPNPSETVSAAGKRVTLSLVRAGVGVWSTKINDGNSDDLDTASNAAVSAQCSSLSAKGRSPEAPTSTQTGDILIGVDSHTMTVTVSTVN